MTKIYHSLPSAGKRLFLFLPGLTLMPSNSSTSSSRGCRRAASSNSSTSNRGRRHGPPGPRASSPYPSTAPRGGCRARVFSVFYYSSGGKKARPAGPADFLTLPLDRDRVVAQVLQRDGKQGITFGVAPRYTRPEKRYEAGKSRDVLEVNCVWGDIDFKNVPGGAIEIYRRLNDLPLKPSIVVNSGYGRHVYYVFNKVLIGKDLLVWEELIRALRDTLQSDATVDLARRMRLPGTLNIKRSEERRVGKECRSR